LRYAKRANKQLENITLRQLTILLLKFLNVDVLPNEITSQEKWYESSTCDNHLSLHIRVRTHHSISLWRATEKRRLDSDVSKIDDVVSLA
jgi:hypothetical protein